MLNYLLHTHPHPTLIPFSSSPCASLGTVGSPLCGVGFICLLWPFFRSSAFHGPPLPPFTIIKILKQRLGLMLIYDGKRCRRCLLWEVQNELSLNICYSVIVCMDSFYKNVEGAQWHLSTHFNIYNAITGPIEFQHIVCPELGWLPMKLQIKVCHIFFQRAFYIRVQKLSSSMC